MSNGQEHNANSPASVEKTGVGEGTPSEIAEQAAQLERLLPAVARTLFAIGHDDPLTELPLGQFRLCALLYREGKRTMSQISDGLGISVSAVTQMADRLERAGMVERTTEPDGDRRARHLHLTEHGAALMRERIARRTHRAENALRQLDPPARAQILHALEELLGASRLLKPENRLPLRAEPE